MATARIKNCGESWYHIVSRTAFQEFKFGEEAKSMFVDMLRRVAYFSGIDVLNYCVMTNHFHILIHVPEKREVPEDELLKRISALYGHDNAEELRRRWLELRKHRMSGKVAEEQASFTRRMGDISPFMKCLKQRYSIWFRHHSQGFAGTLWEGRFKSVIVQGEAGALSAVSAYIDLNPVRAKIVDDPKDYTWSGYSAALAGDGAAMRGIARVFNPDATAKDFTGSALGLYREILYVKGGDAIDEEKVKQVAKEKGKVPLPLLLRCRMRHFLRGTFVGSAEFVEDEFQKHREHFSVGRKKGARPIGRCEEWCGIRLCTARKLRTGETA